jgi:hypothetical protein
MNPSLANLLNKVSTPSSSSTHCTTHPKEKGRNIPPRTLAEFWEQYCALVENKTDNMCLAECPQSYMPFIFEFVLKYPEDATSLYTDAFLKKVVLACQEAIIDYYTLEHWDPLTACVLISPSWTEKRTKNVRIKIHFPYSKIDYGCDFIRLKGAIIASLRRDNVMGTLQYSPLEEWSKCIVNYTSKMSVMMYGSERDPSSPACLLEHIWPYDKEDEIQDQTLFAAFDPCNHMQFLQHFLEREFFHKHDLDYWLPVFLSVGYWMTPLIASNIRVEDTVHIDLPDNGEETPQEQALKFLAMLSTERFVNKEQWLDVGRALYSVYAGEEAGCTIWFDHTAKYTQYNKDDYDEFYSRFVGSSITLRTLAWYAREDSPEVYEGWHNGWIASSLEQALTMSHADVAQAVYRCYWLDFVTCSINARQCRWFRFHRHHWQESEGGVHMLREIRTTFLKRLQGMREALDREVLNDMSFQTDTKDALIKKITNLATKLKDEPYIQKIMSALKYASWYTEGFMGMLDSNYMLTGVGNGVFEVVDKEVFFRKGKPEDYISMYTNVCFHPEYTLSSPCVAQCMEWFGKVFVDDDLRFHFLKFSASCLKGRNSDKIVSMWTGDGGNAKTTVATLFFKTLEKYAISFPDNILSSNKSPSNAPSPELARAKGARIGFIQEPDDSDPMSKTKVKRMAGNDLLYCRFLHDNGRDVEQTHKTVVQCNDPPGVANADKATRNRIRLLMFLSNFVNNPPESVEEQYQQRKFKSDPDFESKLPYLAPGFLWLMYYFYPLYAREGLTEPLSMINATEDYWKENDMFVQFGDERIVLNKDPSVKTSLTEVHREFKSWFEKNYPGVRVPDRIKLRKQLTLLYGPMHMGGWTNIAMNSG